MKLIGMLDSPYVRRVAISLQLLGLRFEHQPLSVFSAFTAFQKINPVVKAPTLICDDGMVLMDSSLILEYAQAIAGRRLVPAGLDQLQRTLRVIGLALTACEKTAQIVYEHNLRPPEKHHEPWLARVTNQLLAAYAELEADVERHPLLATGAPIDQAGISTAVAWHFTQHMLPETVPAARHPALVALSAKAETLPEFIAAPCGNSTFHNSH